MRTATEGAPTKGKGKKPKENGHAGNGVVHDEETLQEVAAREAAEAEREAGGAFPDPGTQAVATQEEEPRGYMPPLATQEQIARAGEVVLALKDRTPDMGAAGCIEGLVQVVDVHPDFTTPEGWPAEEDEVYTEAPVVRQIATLLLRGCPRLGISPGSVSCIWKNHEKWTRRGVTVRANTVSFNQRAQFFTGGVLACIEINYHHFRTLNPLQKIFVIYRALRELDDVGKKNNHDFIGYFDELEVFGPYVFREMVTMASALKRGTEEQDGSLPYQLSLLDELHEDDEDEVD